MVFSEVLMQAKKFKNSTRSVKETLFKIHLTSAISSEETLLKAKTLKSDSLRLLCEEHFKYAASSMIWPDLNIFDVLKKLVCMDQFDISSRYFNCRRSLELQSLIS